MNKLVIFSVEGTQGCGKTTLFKALEDGKVPLPDHFDTAFNERVPIIYKYVHGLSAGWREYYAGIVAYDLMKQPAFTKQMGIIADMSSKLRMAIDQLDDMAQRKHKGKCLRVIIMERGLKSALDLYSVMERQQNKMSEVELHILGEIQSQLLPSTGYETIYLRAPVDLCFDMIKSRDKKSDKDLPQKFICDTHSAHEYLYHNNEYVETLERGDYQDRLDEMYKHFALLVKRRCVYYYPNNGYC